MGKIALVLSAGGSRGAYEAGVIYYLRTSLPKTSAQKNFHIHSGTSVGAINAAFMAAFEHDPKQQSEKLKNLWLNFEQENIYRRDFDAATHFLGSTVGGLFRNLTTLNPFKIAKKKRGPLQFFPRHKPIERVSQKNNPLEPNQKECGGRPR